MKKNVASQVIGAELVSASDGSAFTGSVTAYVTGDGGTQAVGSVSSGACTHEGNGFHTYAPAQAETNYDHIGFTFIGSGAVPVTVQVYTTFPQTGDNYARLGAPAGASVSADVAAVKSDTAAVLVDTGTTLNNLVDDLETRLGTPGDLGGGSSIAQNLADIAGSGFSTSTDSNEAIRNRGDAAWTTATGFSTHSAADVWSVGTRVLTAGTNLNDISEAEVNAQVDAAIETYHLDHLFAADYDPSSKPGTSTALLNELVENDGGVSRFTVNALENGPSGSGASAASIADAVWDEATSGHTTSGTFGEQAKTDIDQILTNIAALNNLSTSQVGDAAWDEVIENGKTARQIMRGLLAAMAGVLDGAATPTITMRDDANSKDRITATVDEDGNRLAVTLDLD